MSTPDVLLTGGTGRVRPQPRWRRHSAQQLHLARLAGALEDASGKYAAGTIARDLLEQAHDLVRRAAALPEPTDPTP